MSPASKSKLKEKKSGKDAQKTPVKPTTSINANSSVPASAYNPHLGTFQVLDSVSISSGSPLHNGRFRSIDEADISGVESDAVSNNGSWSGESEDHKEKTSNQSVRQEVIPGADNDKREKIRQKNERKHQRQKERRAQELHEKCSAYLMSRKLEALTQQLVAMGIAEEHATTALMLNEGKVEESVHWLFDRSEDEVERQSTQNIGNLKINIAEELARIAEIEIRYKCSRQEVERAVVAAEGDLDRAEEALKAQKQDQNSAPVDQEEPGDSPTSSNDKISVGIAYQNSTAPRLQTKPVTTPALPQKGDERGFNYTKSPPMMGGSSQPLNKTAQPLKRLDRKLDLANPQQSAALTEKRWPNPGQTPSASYPLVSPAQSSPQPVKVEARFVSNVNEFKNIQQPLTREPVTMMQRTQVVSTKQVPASSISTSLTGISAGWHPATGIEIMKSNGYMPPHIPSTRSPSPNNLSQNQIYQQLLYQHQQRFDTMVDSNGIAHGGNGNSLWTRNNASPTVAAASSLGLFSGVGSLGTPGAYSPVDWTSGSSMTHLDYTSIDWSLDRNLPLSPRLNGFWSRSTSPPQNNLMYDSNINGYGLKASMGGRVSSNGVHMAGLENGNVGMPAETSTANSRDWTSPFEGKDIFSLSRQYVSPTL